MRKKSFINLSLAIILASSNLAFAEITAIPQKDIIANDCAMVISNSKEEVLLISVNGKDLIGWNNKTLNAKIESLSEVESKINIKNVEVGKIKITKTINEGENYIEKEGVLFTNTNEQQIKLKSFCM